MATQTRAPTSEVAVTGTWSGTNRHLLLDDFPDNGNPINDGTTCSSAGVLALGFSAFTVPAGATAISVQVQYYDFKNAAQSAANGALIRCNDTTNQLAGSHNPGNGNANIAPRDINYAINPKSGAAWTVDDVNGVGINGLTAFGISVTDANPTSTISSIQLQVTYTPSIAGTLSKTLDALTVVGTGTQLNEGVLTRTLGTLSLESDGTVADSGTEGTLNETLGSLTAAGLGEQLNDGTLTHILGVLTAVGTGTQLNEGELAKTLSVLTAAGTGNQLNEGVFEETLGVLAAAGTGSVQDPVITGTLNETLGNLTAAGIGEQLNEGVLSKTLGGLIAVGTGEIPIDGELLESLSPLTLSGIGSVGDTGPVEGTLNKTLGALVVSGHNLPIYRLYYIMRI